MRRVILFLLTAALGAALAPAALAAPAEVSSVELTPKRGQASVARHFTLVGLHWRGPGRVAFRTRSVEGRWSPWRGGAPEAEDGPDSTSPEARHRAGWRIGSPWWVGPSYRIETRTVGRVSRVRAYLVWSPDTRVPYRFPAATVTPPIVPRLSWGADESIRRGPPSYAPAVRFAVVHHTAGRNGYSRSEAAAIVKAIQLYHVQGNGWNDIGYNFLVDRFGTIYEGRFGGIDRNVVGAHALGFNTGSVGVALLGTHGGTPPSQAAQDAIARLLAWRLDLAHVDPTGFATVISGGSERYADGLPVLLRSVSGHRDTGFTECPGNLLYGRLNVLGTAANAIGLPKLYEPRVDTSGRVLRFRARLSSALPWTVLITGAGVAEIARGAGTGSEVDWSWDSTAAPSGRYSWSIRAGTARPAAGSVRIGSAVEPPAIVDVSAEPEAISPNGDGQADTSLISYRLTAPVNLTIEVTDAIGGVVATLVDRVWTQAGAHTAVVDGEGLPDGSYNVVLTGRTAAGLELRELVPLTVNRTLGLVAVTPAVFSPNGDGRRDLLRVTFSLTVPAQVRVRILRGGRWVASPLTSSLLPGTQRLSWDGKRPSGRLRDGEYSAVVEASDAAGGISFAASFASDTVAPRVQILPGRPLRLRVSEAAALTLLVDGSSLRQEATKAGIVRVRWRGPAARVRVVAWDAAGNRSRPVIRVAAPGRPERRE